VVLGFQQTVFQHFDPTTAAGDLRVVGHQHRRRAAPPLQREEELEDLLAARWIEVAGRLVGEQQRRLE